MSLKKKNIKGKKIPVPPGLSSPVISKATEGLLCHVHSCIAMTSQLSLLDRMASELFLSFPVVYLSFCILYHYWTMFSVYIWFSWSSLINQ